jgi:predicted nucleotidyltransferase component of viral defense system
VLTYALQMLSEAGQLDGLAFKGGTCIRKLWVGPTGRFSMDLDFTSQEPMKPDDAILTLMEILNRQFHGIEFRLEDDWRITQGELSFTTHPSYRHDWNPDGGFDLQISLRESPTLDVESRAHIEQAYFKDLEFQPAPVPTLEEHELLAEKIRAAYQRAKVRDLHDLFVYATKPLDRHLLRRLVVIKLWQVGDTFDPEAFFLRIREGKYNWADLRRLIRGTVKIDPDEMIARTVSSYRFLNQLSEEEVVLASDGKAHREEDLWKSLVASCKKRKLTGEF